MKIFLIIGLLLSLLGSLILIWGYFLSDEAINQLSGTYFDQNKFLKENLESNRNRARLGFSLLAAGFFLQIVDTIWSPGRRIN